MAPSARFAFIFAIVGAGLVLDAAAGAYAADDSAPVRTAAAAQTAPAPATGEQSGNAKPLDVKNVFRNICGFCHEDYGRHAGKGPQLMNSERTDEYLFNRIKHGKPGRMPAWGSVFNDDQIHQIVEFIRSLKPNEEPHNPT